MENLTRPEQFALSMLKMRRAMRQLASTIEKIADACAKVCLDIEQQFAVQEASRLISRQREFEVFLKRKELKRDMMRRCEGMRRRQARRR